MKKKHFSLTIVIIFQLLSVANLAAQDFEMPGIHTTVTMDAKFYSGDDAEDESYIVPDNSIYVRKAAIGLFGEHGNIEYDIEFGSATCSPGGLQVMEASIMYRYSDNFRFGLKKGHVMRGFKLWNECTNTIPLEKPKFGKTFSPCHVPGVFINYDHEFSTDTAIEMEFGYMNGPGGTIDEEHDMNFGMFLYPPIPNIAVSAFYTLAKQKFWTMNENFNYVQKAEDGYRAGFGLEYEIGDFHISGEYYLGKMFNNQTSMPDDSLGVELKDLENNAYYAQAAYTIRTPLKKISYIQPYFQYEWWDKAANSDIETEYSYISTGLTLSLDANSKVKFNYEIPVDSPEGTPDEAKIFVIRFQTTL